MAHQLGVAVIGNGTNAVLRKGHPQDFANPATAEEADSDPKTELYSVPSLTEWPNLEPSLEGTVTMGRDRPIRNDYFTREVEAAVLSVRKSWSVRDRHITLCRSLLRGYTV